MEAFTEHTGLVLPLDRANVDTDFILPKQYLKYIYRTGFSDWLFDDVRYLDPGDVDTPTETRRPNPDFILNDARYQDASILLARENFGCGSSRESAVWALKDYGFKVVIAPSFADIFYNNCSKNGVLAVILAAGVIDRLFDKVASQPQSIKVNLEYCVVNCGGEAWQFTIDAARRENLLLGRDDITRTLEFSSRIEGFEKQLRDREPWLFNNPSDHS